MKSKKQYDYEIGKTIQKARRRKKMNQEADDEMLDMINGIISVSNSKKSQ